MSENINDNIGTIRISEEVIAILANKAAREIEGIADMASTPIGNSIAAVLGKKVSTRGIVVDIKETNVTITLHVVMNYGSRVPDVAWNVQESVKNAVESSTGLKVQKVNVVVDNIKFDTDEVQE